MHSMYATIEHQVTQLFLIFKAKQVAWKLTAYLSFARTVVWPLMEVRDSNAESVTISISVSNVSTRTKLVIVIHLTESPILVLLFVEEKSDCLTNRRI